MADKNRKILSEKVTLGKLSTESEKIFGNRREIWNKGKCIIASGGWTPLFSVSFSDQVTHVIVIVLHFFKVGYKRIFD